MGAMSTPPTATRQRPRIGGFAAGDGPAVRASSEGDGGPADPGWRRSGGWWSRPSVCLVLVILASAIGYVRRM